MSGREQSRSLSMGLQVAGGELVMGRQERQGGPWRTRGLMRVGPGRTKGGRVYKAGLTTSNLLLLRFLIRYLPIHPWH